ncbi:aminotransferase class I/II-fold pyridoxal phosphate-dependent enzyme [Romeria aff. gracilis LEGE 07310]|uniref:Aminotransferase class I/II-fold pyridoxal phosphate-dependent enzyme n=1 Tax=Vasconcelosia minhoensis LEGE 07310 TaxID=915328 RepID=A0A8J7AG93_9CYAN|nr:aminotransferase class I/II-fold pyridoxal phosphate-dependent enzyme [Romeria gracilis]MBE9076978.1 aminotransferase class I/II-fold pyridoxal phosphate-dependent enzyme [Romeria aff. gracilis LEGE 07310]
MESMDQSAAPLVEALRHCAIRPNAAFYTPGHKRGRGVSQRHRDLFGASVFTADLPELPELDNLFAPEGVILAAQELAAEAFGAEQTWFLANGSTSGVEAAILATCGPGEKLILPRNAHRSAIAGLILSGAQPVYVTPDYDPDWGLAHSITADAIAQALAQHPDARAVLITSPTYQGICADVEEIAELAHRHALPLIVDEAHGAHFAFHPELPTPALRAGADIVIQSAHKVLSAFTQAALLHAQGSRIDRHRLSQALALTQSSSPSYLLLGSLDAARQQMATEGLDLIAQALTRADRARQRIAQLPGLRVIGPQIMGRTPGCADWDRTRLTVDVSGLGMTGYEADRMLHKDWGVTAELPTLQQLTFIVGWGNDLADMEQLVEALAGLRDRGSGPLNLPKTDFTELERSIETGCSPRQAFFAPTQILPVADAVGRISAETVCPYPPGIPTLLPGERISAAAIRALQQVLAVGGVLTGCRDATLQTLAVVQSKDV